MLLYYPVYPEFLPEDDVLPVEEQPLPVAASPTTESSGYIPESDPKEDPADYPAAEETTGMMRSHLTMTMMMMMMQRRRST
ncbi:hypothetical protein Tco_0473464, partial [Tanacetum coccineum]